MNGNSKGFGKEIKICYQKMVISACLSGGPVSIAKFSVQSRLPKRWGMGVYKYKENQSEPFFPRLDTANLIFLVLIGLPCFSIF